MADDAVQHAKPEFEIGDGVQLKGGGPPMTVCEVGERAVLCRWFHADLALFDAWFKVATLRKITMENKDGSR